MDEFDRAIKRATNRATEESLERIGEAMSIKYGSPLERLATELRLYARHLETWTCSKEDFGAVRPLRELLADAALAIFLQAQRNSD